MMDHNCDLQKMNSKKTSIAVVIKTKTQDDVAKKASTLIIAIDNGGKIFNISIPISNST